MSEEQNGGPTADLWRGERGRFKANNPGVFKAGNADGCQFQLGNKDALVHGGYSRQVQEDMRPWVTEVLAQVVADKGGMENLTELQRQAIEHGLGPLLAVMKSTGQDIVANHALSAKGKARAVVGAHQRALDRFVKLAQLIGLDRTPRQVDTFEAAITREPIHE